MVAEVIRVQARHIPLLALFYKKTWDPLATPETVQHARENAAAHNPHGPGEDIPTFLFLNDGEPIGHITTIPIKLWLQGTERNAYYLKGFMVLPQYQNGPVGYLLLKEAIRYLECSIALVVQLAARRLIESMGYTDLGTLPNAVRILEPGKILLNLDLNAIGMSSLPWLSRTVISIASNRLTAPLISACAKALMNIGVKIFGLPERQLDIAQVTELDSLELDRLWRQVREELAAAPMRDSVYITRRYREATSVPYRFITVRDKTQLVALAVLREPRAVGDPRLRGIRVATLSELIFPPSRRELAGAALSGAEMVARQMNADVILFSTSHRSIHPLLWRRAFIRIPGNIHVLVRDSKTDSKHLPLLEDWWLTRGDSNADEVF